MSTSPPFSNTVGIRLPYQLAQSSLARGSSRTARQNMIQGNQFVIEVYVTKLLNSGKAQASIEGDCQTQQCDGIAAIASITQ